MISPPNPNPNSNPNPNPNPNLTSKSSRRNGLSTFPHHTNKISRVSALSTDRDAEPPLKKAFLGPHRPRRDDERPVADRRVFIGYPEGGRGSDLKSVELERDEKIDNVAKKSAFGKKRIHHQETVEVNTDSIYREEYSDLKKKSGSDRKIGGGGDLLVEREGFVLRIRNSRSHDEEQTGTIRNFASNAEYKGSGSVKRPSSAKGVDKPRNYSHDHRLLLKRSSKTLRDLNGREEVPKSLVSGASVRKISDSLSASSVEGDTSTRSLNASADAVEQDEKSPREAWDVEFSIDFLHIMKKPRTHRHRRRHEDKADTSIQDRRFLEMTGGKDGSHEMQEASAIAKAVSDLNSIHSHCKIAEDECLKSRVLSHLSTKEGLAEPERDFYEEPEKVKEDKEVIINNDDKLKNLDASEEEILSEEQVKQSRNSEGTKLEENPSTLMTQVAVEQKIRDAAMIQEMMEEANIVQDGGITAVEGDRINTVQHNGVSIIQDDEIDNVVDEDANDAEDNLGPKSSIPVFSGKPENPKERWLQDFLHERVLEKEEQATHTQNDDEQKQIPLNKEITIPLLNEADEDKGEVPGSNKQQDLSSEEILIRSVHLQCDVDNRDKVDDHWKHANHSQKQTEPEMGSFQLSLGLPLASIASEGSGLPFAVTASLKCSPNRSQSLFHTNSDGFTTSFSFSSSSSFMHNESCSLNYASEGQQLSSGCSREIAEGHRQSSQQKSHQVQSISDSRLMQSDGNAVHQHGIRNLNTQGILTVVGRAGRENNGECYLGQSFQVIPDHRRKLSGTDKALVENPHHQEFRQLTAAEEFAQATKSRHPVAKGDVQLKSHILENTNRLDEKFGLHEIVTEPVAMMAQKMQELPESVLEGLKRLTKDLLGDFEKREEFFMLRNEIMRRKDLTERTLLHANMAQLEIFIALKTGLQDYVKEGSKPLTYKVLIEILLDKRCPNISCKQMLPVNGCECTICSRKHGFCSECMCVVCYKFDSDNGSCQWVGCDACEHWCHADCALRKSYIITGGGNSVGMQYCCVSCDRHCDLFGFVKGVFQNFSHGWSADAFLKELDCVQRIFHGSEDTRGKQLYYIAGKMLQQLEMNLNPAEIQKSMLKFFNDENTGVDPVKNHRLASKDSDLHSAVQKSIYPQATNFSTELPDMNKVSMAKEEDSTYLQTVGDLKSKRSKRMAEIASIASMVRTKQEEAMMFQMQADEANGAASNLRRIISAKQEKIEQDFAYKSAQLRLSEAEDKRKKMLEELQVLERAQHDYRRMKIMMEVQIKDLLMKLGVSKWQYA